MTSNHFQIQKSAIAAQLTPHPTPPRFASRGLSLAPRSARFLANFGFTEGMVHYLTVSVAMTSFAAEKVTIESEAVAAAMSPMVTAEWISYMAASEMIGSLAVGRKTSMS
jgi:hypothetical protein